MGKNDHGKDRILIALGGLLHDVGKFVQRAKREKGKSVIAERKDLFGYAHAEESFRTSKEIIPLLELDKLGDGVKLIISSSFHHAPDTRHEEAKKELFNVRALFRVADWYASVERSDELESEKRDAFKRLRPVFEGIDIGKGRASQEFFYTLGPLSVGKEVIFPVPRKEAQDYVSEEDDPLYREYYGSYSEIYEAFKYALKNFKNKRFKSISHALSFFYHTMYKYTWCVPASIYDRENYHSHYPDISLFDHSRIVSALATSLYTSGNLEKLSNYTDNRREEFAKQLNIIVLEGDVSGIQKFLYDIANIKGSSKRLRGRSIFLSLLPDLIGRYILKSLGYPWINLIYSGGGKFQAIVGWEENIEDRLKDLSKEVERLLIKEFKGKLGFVLYFKVISLDELTSYHKAVRDLTKEAEKAKLSKFKNWLESYENLVDYEPSGAEKLCPSCNWELIPDDNELCLWCERFEEVGSCIPKSRYVAFTESRNKKLEERGFYLEGIGGVYFLREEDLKYLSDKDEVYVINDTDSFEEDPYAVGFKFIANTVPLKEEDGETTIKTFEEIAEESEGDKKIAFVRADVDNLGFIFMKGLGNKYTFSRVATLSRSLDLFFSGYLTSMFEKEFGGKIYTVYAGGDDLFIVTAWSTALKAVLRIREELSEYTCFNPNIGLSCGVFLTHGSYPIRIASESAERAESEAKSKEGKDSINALGETLSWQDVKEALEETEEILGKVGEELGRTNMYRIYLLLKNYKKLREKGDDRRFMFYPFFYYYLSRNVKESYRAIVEELFIDKDKDYEVKDRAVFNAKYILLRTRDVRY